MSSGLQVRSLELSVECRRMEETKSWCDWTRSVNGKVMIDDQERW